MPCSSGGIFLSFQDGKPPKHQKAVLQSLTPFKVCAHTSRYSGGVWERQGGFDGRKKGAFPLLVKVAKAKRSAHFPIK